MLKVVSVKGKNKVLRVIIGVGEGCNFKYSS